MAILQKRSVLRSLASKRRGFGDDAGARLAKSELSLRRPSVVAQARRRFGSGSRTEVRAGKQSGLECLLTLRRSRGQTLRVILGSAGTLWRFAR